MIRLEKVNKYFNRHKKNEIHVINNTSLELPDSGLIALLGPSGCGKTTLLNSIGGLDRVRSGNIYINNQRITKKRGYFIDKVRNLNIGYIFQNYYLIDNKTVYDNVALSLKMIGIKDKEEIKKRVNYVLETLGIYRYRNRKANMLSGGERQRVGIARAIVKDPSIIIADEPTGNLDSANTIETMNIIKAISQKRLVLLVTHENDIAKFYADRIIEIEDGVIKSDYDNKHDNNLDYRLDNKIYLKDFKYNTFLESEDNKVNIYSDNKKDLKLTIVVKNNNIYIQGPNNNKIEIVDSDSNIELINDHYKQIDKSIYEKYTFHFASIISHKEKARYSSIFNPLTLLTAGFKRILDYSFLKKILLLGFLVSGAFIAYCVVNIAGLTKIEDSYFIKKNRNYYYGEIANLSPKDLKEYESFSSVDYILPGDSFVSFKVKYPFLYQTMDAQSALTGSITSNKYLKKEDLIYGRMPLNSQEIVVDKMVLKNMIANQYVPSEVGMTDFEDYLNQEVELKLMERFLIVGITNNEDPSIYADENLLIDMLANSYSEYDYEDSMDELYLETLLNYELYSGLQVKKGRLPLNDYEVLVSIDWEYDYPLNKKIDYKVNGKELTVVGYYDAKDCNLFLVNANTITYSLLENAKGITIMPLAKDTIIDEFKGTKTSVISTYDYDLNVYKENKAESVMAGLIVSAIILAISFIEIYLMIRASFLSRIKEIGIYRAIGVKKGDIYKMFFGEIFAITTVACIPGALLITYIINTLSSISYFNQNFLVNGLTILISIIIIYSFNIIIGLLPVLRVVRQTPAEILARKDID